MLSIEERFQLVFGTKIMIVDILSLFLLFSDEKKKEEEEEL